MSELVQRFDWLLRRPAARLGFGVAAALLAALLRWFLEPVLPSQLSFLTFYLALFVSAWHGGLWASVPALIIGALVGDYFFLEPRYSFRLDWPGSGHEVLRFAVVGAGFIGITEIVRRRAVRESEAMLREVQARERSRSQEVQTILEAAPAIIWMAHDPAAAVITGNPASYDFLRLPRDANASKSAPEGTAPTHFEVIADGRPLRPEELPVQRAARGEEIHGWEEEVRFSDGTSRWLFGNAVPLRDPDGQPKGAVAAFVDVTERIQAEKSLALALRRQEALYNFVERRTRVRSFEDLYGAVLDTIMAAIGCDRASLLLFDEAGVMRFVASRGLSREYCAAVEGHSPWSRADTDPVPIRISDIESAGLEPELTRTIMSEGIRALGFIPIMMPEGLAGKFMIYYDSPHEFQDDEIELGLTIARQLAAALARYRAERDLARAQRQLEERAEQLAELDRRKDAFLATLAHELRGPLAPLRNMLEVAKHSGPVGGDFSRALETMERQVNQLVRLVDDLLDVSRITQDRLELRPEPVDLARVIHHSAEACAGFFESAGHTLRITLPDQPCHLVADPIRITQVFTNLLHNAAKYTSPGGLIELVATRRESVVSVVVRDNGSGIPLELLPRIFGMFAQGDLPLSRTQGGLGIGLALVKKLVELHGGTVSARSEGPGKGAEFEVSLPLGSRQSPPVAAQVRSGNGQGPARSRRILIVDDNRDSTESLAALLQLASHEAHLAFDGEQALEQARQIRPEIVLLDLGLPKLDGYEVARRIRAEPWGGDIMLIALTGWGQESDRQRSREAGFDRHLVKPVQFAELEDVLGTER